MNILLIGPRGSGKTTIGRDLAVRLGRRFIDLDDVTLSHFGESSVEAIWSAHGESAWRDAEARALDHALSKDDQILALGGGTPTIPSAGEAIRLARGAGRAVVVYLNCPPELLERRLSNEPGDRPGLTGRSPAEEIRAVLADREPTYLDLADLVVDAGEATTVEATVEAIRTGVHELTRGAD